MSFKENLLKKIKINQLAQKVLHSIGPADSGLKIDKEAMRSLLEMGPYRYRRERDLDLYIEEDSGDGQSIILVLDNELPIYQTTVEDVVMRKSPYTKEMLNIRNAIKILKDSDVKLSRKEESLETVRKRDLDALDLSYTESDIAAIAREGSEALEYGNTDDIHESLFLFAELLHYQPPPKPFRMEHHDMIGAVTEKAGGEILYGPLVVLNLADNSLRMFDDRISSMDKEKMEYFKRIIQGKEKASREGPAVFAYLKNEVHSYPENRAA